MPSNLDLKSYRQSHSFNVKEYEGKLDDDLGKLETFNRVIQEARLNSRIRSMTFNNKSSNEIYEKLVSALNISKSSNKPIEEVKKTKFCSSSKTVLQSREYTSKFDEFNTKVKEHKHELLIKIRLANRSASSKNLKTYFKSNGNKLEMQELRVKPHHKVKSEQIYAKEFHKISESSSYQEFIKTQDTVMNQQHNSKISSKLSFSSITKIGNNEKANLSEHHKPLSREENFDCYSNKKCLTDCNESLSDFRKSGIDYSSHIKNKSNPDVSRALSGYSSTDCLGLEMAEIDGLTSEIAECNLRKFYKYNANKFEERVKKGPPSCFRWLSWMLILKVPEQRNEAFYEYNYLPNLKDEVELQIKKDLNRTIPEYIIADFNEKEIADKEFVLYRLLKSFAINDPEVSYCQGMNYIASFLLMTSDYNEIETFYVMLSLFSKTFTSKLGIRGFYTQGFHLLNFYVLVFDHFFQFFNPKLRKHMVECLELQSDLWVSKWFMTLFTICLPFEVVSRVWDCLFATDLLFLIKFTFSFLKNIESTILRFNDTFDILDFFKSLSPFENLSLVSEATGAFKYNIEQILADALKINLNLECISTIKSQYEKKHKIKLTVLETKYDLNKVIEHDCDFYSENAVNSRNSTPLNAILKDENRSSLSNQLALDEFAELKHDFICEINAEINQMDDPEVNSENYDDIESKISMYKFKLTSSNNK